MCVCVCMCVSSLDLQRFTFSCSWSNRFHTYKRSSIDSCFEKRPIPTMFFSKTSFAIRIGIPESSDPLGHSGMDGGRVAFCRGAVIIIMCVQYVHVCVCVCVYVCVDEENRLDFFDKLTDLPTSEVIFLLTTFGVTWQD